MLSFLKHHKQDFILTLLIFCLALLMRLWQINGEGINPDEYRWHDRTNRFYDAIQDNRWGDTLTAGHPGATVTWQSMISLRTMRRVFRQFDPTYDYQDYPHLTHTWNRVHFSYVLPIVIISSLFIAFLYASLRYLTNRPFALIASCMVLFEVYFLAHSRVVQMDAIQTSYIISSILAALVYKKSNHKLWLILAGVLTGFNVMTKIYGLSILPIIWLIICWEDITQFIHSKNITGIKNIFYSTFLLGITLLITSIILLPTWVTNLNLTLETFKNSILNEGVQGMWEGNEFFFGRLYPNGEPRWFYLVALFFRQSIIPFLALPLTIILLIKNKIRERSIRDISIIFILVAIYWILMLSIPSKKEDRYILLSHVLFSVASASAVYIGYLFIKSKGVLNKYLSTTMIFIGLLITIYSLNGLNYEYLGYYNPILGGGKSAVKFMRVGWGEGLRPMAEYLNKLEDPSNIKVSAWYEGSFSPLCDCSVLPTFVYEDSDVEYLVYYVNQLQRQKEEIMTEKYFQEDNVIYTYSIKGLTYSWLVKKP